MSDVLQHHCELRVRSEEETRFNGREVPDICDISFEFEEGKAITVLWNIGKVKCAYCGTVSRSYQGLHQHMAVKHKKEMERHAKETLRNGIRRSFQEDDATCALMRKKVAESISKKTETAEQILVCSNDGRSSKQGNEANADGEEKKKAGII